MSTPSRLLGSLLLCALLTAGIGPPESSLRPLWDGETFEGWYRQGGGSWTIEDGVLIGSHQAGDERHGHLITDQTFDDFRLRVRYKAVRGNSGLYFRVEEVGGAVGVHGFQAEIDPRQDVGGLYETGGRAWVVQPDSAKVATYFRPGDWNTMTVRAVSDTIEVRVNGTLSAEVRGEVGRQEGRIALQLHGSQDVRVLFSEIAIEELSD